MRRCDQLDVESESTDQWAPMSKSSEDASSTNMCPGACVMASDGREASSTTCVTVVLQWCYTGVTLVLQWCYNGVTIVLQWSYNGASVE
jgi:hypothetical protein